MTNTRIEWADTRVGNSRIKTPEGYILVYCPTHPSAKSSGHIYEHRYVMEKHLKRFLSSSEHVHHINGIKDDNRVENLEIIDHSEHAKKHYKKKSQEDKKRFIQGAIRSAQKRKFERKEVFCACGCGKTLINRDSKGRLRKYIWGHNQRNKHWRWYAKIKD